MKIAVAACILMGALSLHAGTKEYSIVDKGEFIQVTHIQNGEIKAAFTLRKSLIQYAKLDTVTDRKSVRLEIAIHSGNKHSEGRLQSFYTGWDKDWAKLHQALNEFSEVLSTTKSQATDRNPEPGGSR